MHTGSFHRTNARRRHPSECHQPRALALRDHPFCICVETVCMSQLRMELLRLKLVRRGGGSGQPTEPAESRVLKTAPWKFCPAKQHYTTVSLHHQPALKLAACR